MSVAAIGPLTSLMEAAAAAVGAGMLLGGFASGVVGLLLTWPKPDFDTRVLRDGYIGGAFGAGVIFADIMFRYAI